MSQTPDHRTPDSPAAGEPAGFGANEWLVDEMYERFQADPSSVPGEWAAWFRGGGANGSGGNGSASSPAPATAAPVPAPAATPSAHAPAPSAPAARSDAARPEPAADTPEPAARPAPVARPRPQSAAAEPARGTTAPMAKEAPPTAAAQATDDPGVWRLRSELYRARAETETSLMAKGVFTEAARAGEARADGEADR